MINSSRTLKKFNHWRGCYNHLAGVFAAEGLNNLTSEQKFLIWTLSSSYFLSQQHFPICLQPGFIMNTRKAHIIPVSVLMMSYIWRASPSAGWGCILHFRNFYRKWSHAEKNLHLGLKSFLNHYFPECLWILLIMLILVTALCTYTSLEPPIYGSQF